MCRCKDCILLCVESYYDPLIDGVMLCCNIDGREIDNPTIDIDCPDFEKGDNGITFYDGEPVDE